MLRIAKSLFIAGALAIASLSVNAAQWEEGKHYTEFESLPKTEKPQIVEFFSVFCPACYNLEANRQILEQHLPSGIEKHRVHVNFPRGTDEQGFNAIAKAVALGKVYPEIADDLIWSLFTQIHERKVKLKEHDVTRTIGFFQDRTEANLHEAYDSFQVRAIARKMPSIQRMAMREGMLKGVPTMVVNGRYRINFDQLDPNNFFEELGELVDYLTQL